MDGPKFEGKINAPYWPWQVYFLNHLHFHLNLWLITVITELQNETDVQFYFTVMTDKQKFWARQKAKQVVRVEKSIDDPSAEPETESEPTAEGMKCLIA